MFKALITFLLDVFATSIKFNILILFEISERLFSLKIVLRRKQGHRKENLQSGKRKLAVELFGLITQKVKYGKYMLYNLISIYFYTPYVFITVQHPTC